MKILDILDSAGHEDLISYGDKTFKKNDFSEFVRSLSENLNKKKELCTDNFVIIKEDRPIYFYALVFALWKNGNKVVFPSRDFMEYGEKFPFYEYVLSLDGMEAVVEKNDIYSSIDLPKDGDVILFSSGSTGEPKGILHNRENLIRNAISVASRIDYRRYSSVTPLKPYLASALSHFLVHFLSDAHLRFIDYDDISQCNLLCEKEPSLAFVGSPRHIMSFGSNLDPQHNPLYFFSSGDYFYPNYISKIINKFPGTTFFNVYGLAELAGRFFINRIDKSSSESDYLFIGNNIDGTTFRTSDEQLYVSSDFLFSGYVKGKSFISSGNEHPTGDLIRVEGDNNFLYGRVNDEIKIGGNKVSLKNIERKVSGLLPDDVCIVFDVAHPRLGTLIALAIYSEKEHSRSDLQDILKKDLKPYELPHAYYYVEDIPYTQTMKIDRKELKNGLDKLTPIM